MNWDRAAVLATWAWTPPAKPVVVGRYVSHYRVANRRAKPEVCRAMYESGLSLRRIGTQLGCHPTTVRHAIMQAGGEMRSVGGRGMPIQLC